MSHWKYGAIARLPASSGRTLLELLVVLAIAGIMASMAGPAFQSLNARLQARTATAEIASTLRMARQLAMARRERLLMRFDLSGKTISLQRAEADGILNVYRYGDKGIVVDEPTAGCDLLFHPSGRSATASTIIIHDRDNRRTTITVSLSGRVVIS
ncbi:MAG TPA: GspH/FimT family pseudopilin [Nitrospira sp.]|nr:GspH/FimT family pseudopilin [Nitrospira sp.]